MQAKPKIGVVIPIELCELLFHDRDKQRLEELGDVQWVTTHKRNAVELDEVRRVLRDAEIGIGSWGTPHPGKPEVMEVGGSLRLWLHVAGSVKAMFTPENADRDLMIASCKGAIADNVAEMVLAEIILGVRRLYDNAMDNRKGKADKHAKMKVLGACTVGVVGASQVGRRVIKLLRPFEPTVLVFDPILDDAGAAELGVELIAGLTDLCRRSDVVTLHTPALPATKHLMGADQFQAMGDDAIFINTSRGECVDEAALVAELQKGRLIAFLDVTDPEPAADDSPLRSLPNVYLTSHIAGPPGKNMGTQAVRDVEAFIQGRAPDCVVTREMLSYVA